MFPLEVFGKDSVVHFFEKIADKIHKEFEIEAYILQILEKVIQRQKVHYSL